MPKVVSSIMLKVMAASTNGTLKVTVAGSSIARLLVAARKPKPPRPFRRLLPRLPRFVVVEWDDTSYLSLCVLCSNHLLSLLFQFTTGGSCILTLSSAHLSVASRCSRSRSG